MDLQEATSSRPAGSPGQQSAEVANLKKLLDEQKKKADSLKKQVDEKQKLVEQLELNIQVSLRPIFTEVVGIKFLNYQ